MKRPNFEAARVLVLTLSLGACAGSTPAAGSASGARMTPAEARRHRPVVVRVDAENRITFDDSVELPGPVLNSLRVVS